MAEELTIESLRAAIRSAEEPEDAADDARFDLMARRFELAVQRLMEQIKKIVEQVPELEVTLEDETEVFTAPGYPGRSVEIRDQRLRITRASDFLLFDPTAKALLSAMGQVEVMASRPMPFMVEKVLYLIPEGGGSSARWAYRSVDNLGGPLTPFGQHDLLLMLRAVFAARE